MITVTVALDYLWCLDPLFVHTGQSLVRIMIQASMMHVFLLQLKRHTNINGFFRRTCTDHKIMLSSIGSSENQNAKCSNKKAFILS